MRTMEGIPGSGERIGCEMHCEESGQQQEFAEREA
jgi:hypothetical protein